MYESFTNLSNEERLKKWGLAYADPSISPYEEKTSVIAWYKDISKAPSEENLLVIYKDETGDNVNYHTVVAWKTYKDNHWISDNEEIFHEIILWSRLPQFEDIHEFINHCKGS